MKNGSTSPTPPTLIRFLKKPDVHLAMARLAVEAPKHPLVIEYTGWLESSIKNSKFDPLLNQPNY